MTKEQLHPLRKFAISNWMDGKTVSGRVTPNCGTSVSDDHRADGSASMIPKVFPSASLQYACHPAPGIGIFGVMTFPPASTILRVNSSTLRVNSSTEWTCSR